MKWWIWLILVVLAVVVFGFAVAYAVSHAMRAAKSAAAVGGDVMEILGAYSDVPQVESSRTQPAFTEPIGVTAQRYSAKHTAVVERKLGQRDKHARLWGKWNREQNLHERPVPGSESGTANQSEA